MGNNVHLGARVCTLGCEHGVVGMQDELLPVFLTAAAQALAPDQQRPLGLGFAYVVLGLVDAPKQVARAVVYDCRSLTR